MSGYPPTPGLLDYVARMARYYRWAERQGREREAYRIFCDCHEWCEAQASRGVDFERLRLHWHTIVGGSRHGR